jgi:hypothetical protein
MTEGDRPVAAADERLEAAVAGPGATALAAIWATVDLERTLADLTDFGVDDLPVVDDTLIGARVVLVTPPSDGELLAIAEPTTEGRLAATLARHGEGPAGRYVAVADNLARARARAADNGIALSQVGEGPFGASMLVLVGSASGPHLILCNPAVPSVP